MTAGGSLAQPTAAGFAPIAHPQDTQAQRNYLQTYTYDPVGNILRMKHVSGGVTVWQRGYDYAQDGNRLLATSLPGDDVDDPQTYSDTYAHDVHGSMTAMPSIPGGLTWDPQDRLQKTDHQGGGVTYYVYDSAGMRVRKVHLNQAATTSKERYYLGPWETYRETTDLQGTPTLDQERETLHVHTPAGAVVLLETKTVENATALQNPTTHHRYQHSNHLGTATLELSEDAEVITYEEYHPYGTSSYRAANAALDVSPKRYRYTGKERDEETGLYYHEARYYGCWLARWTAADPIGLQGGINRFAYAANQPPVMHDPDGRLPLPGTEIALPSRPPGSVQELVRPPDLTSHLNAVRSLEFKRNHDTKWGIEPFQEGSAILMGGNFRQREILHKELSRYFATPTGRSARSEVEASGQLYLIQFSGVPTKEQGGGLTLITQFDRNARSLEVENPQSGTRYDAATLIYESNAGHGDFPPEGLYSNPSTSKDVAGEVIYVRMLLQDVIAHDQERETLHVHTPAGAEVLLETKAVENAAMFALGLEPRLTL